MFQDIYFFYENRFLTIKVGHVRKVLLFRKVVYLSEYLVLTMIELFGNETRIFRRFN